MRPTLDLLYVRSLFRPRDFGGNRYPWEVTRRLAGRGHRVRVITPRPNGPLPGPTAAEMRFYPVWRQLPLATFVTNAVLSRLMVERECLRSRPGLIVFSSYETAYGYFAVGGGPRCIPNAYIYHGRFLSDAIERLRRQSPPRGWAGRLVGAFSEHAERVVLRSAQAVIAVSPFSVGEIAERTGRRQGVELIPTGVDVDLFAPGDRVAARADLGLASDARVLITVGRLSPVKRYDRAIDVLALLRERDRRYVLLIVGDGPERKHLGAYADARGVADAVRFEGFRDGLELVRRLHAADVQLCTSEFENWSLALLEAFGAGCPVVGVPRGGIPQLVGLVDKRLVAADVEPRSIAAAVADLLDAAGRRNDVAASGSVVVRDRFGWDRVIDRLEATLLRCAARPT